MFTKSSVPPPPRLVVIAKYISIWLFGFSHWLF